MLSRRDIAERGLLQAVFWKLMRTICRLTIRNKADGVTSSRTNLTQSSPHLTSAIQMGALMLMLVSSLTGCQSLYSSHAQPYTVNNLPQNWQATPETNVQTVALTKLATDSIPIDQIGNGDVLEVNLAAGLSAEDSIEFSVRVNDNGEAILPNIGPVYLHGLTLEAAESAIRIACIEGQLYRNPHVVVTMKQRKVLQVTVVGAVEEEGTFTLRSGSAGLLHAISQAGGFSDEAGTNVEIRYPSQKNSNSSTRRKMIAGEVPGGAHQISTQAGLPEHSLLGHQVPVQTAESKTIKIDLASFSDTDPSELELTDGAVIMVERRDPLPLQVLGLVNKPDIYEYPVGKSVHLLDAIALAGGQSSLVANKVFVIRRRPNQAEPALIQLSMNEAKRSGKDNILLEPGDTVSIEQTPGTVVLETIRLIGFSIGGSVF